MKLFTPLFFLLISSLVLLAQDLTRLNIADPHIIVVGNEYWVYGTRGSSSFQAWSSTDLNTWSYRGDVLNIRNAGWTGGTGQAWAPGMYQHTDGKYYFYYSVGPNSRTNGSQIGVAIGNSPNDTFVDSGAALLNSEYFTLPFFGKITTFEATDPMVFRDDDGTVYMFSGGSAGSNLQIHKLNATTPTTIASGALNVTDPPNFTEGAFVHKADNGLYYLTYSNGNWADNTYSVHYAITDAIGNPWQYMGELLGSDSENFGPGHNSVFRSIYGYDVLAYHRWEDDFGNPTNSGNNATRYLAFQRIIYGDEGIITLGALFIPEPSRLVLLAGLLLLTTLSRRRDK